MRYLIALLCALCAGLCHAENIEREVFAPYVEVSAGDDYGAGTVFLHKGKPYILTAGHVVIDAYKAGTPVYAYKEWDGRGRWAWKCDVLAAKFDGGYSPDYAILRPRQASSLLPATFAESNDVIRGEETACVGTPLGFHAGLDYTRMMRREYRVGGFPYIVYAGVSSTFGSSGGGVYVLRNDRWVYVGMTTRLYAADFRSGMMAQPVDVLRKCIKDTLAK